MWCNSSSCYTQVRFSEDIGEIYKVRLSFDDDVDAEQNWLLDTVNKIFISKRFCYYCMIAQYSLCETEETIY